MSKVEYFKFVDENAKIFEGEEARELLSTKSDDKYISDDGIVKVSRDRWEIAQKYEKSEWLERAPNVVSDRNEFHRTIFGNYRCLNKLKPKSFIELGCGPFTNARLILQKFSDIDDITLLDPLAADYISSHKNCKYKDSILDCTRFKKPVNIHSCAIEDFNPTKTYDMVVMINVLEHCFDIPKIFDKVYNMLSDDGVFIYADVHFDLETIKVIAKTRYNAGHPIRPTKEFITNTLKTQYDEMFSRKIYEEVASMDAEEFYFIGKKKK